MFKKSLLALCLSASLATGCGGDGGGGGPTDLSGICNANDGVFVEFIDRILECNPIFELFIALPTPAETATGCNASLQPFIDDGTVTVDQAAVAACRTWLMERTCETISESPSPCDGVFVGTLAAGESCDDDAQCMGASFCNTSAPGCGVCRSKKADGANCLEDDECTGGSCDDQGTGTCRTLGQLSDTCAADADCAGQLICTATACAAEPTWAAGVACEKFDACGWPNSGLFCDTTTLKQCDTVKGLGDPCDAVLECDLNGGMACDVFVTATCVSTVEVAAGADCSPFFGLDCAAGLVCDDDGMNGQKCRTADVVGDSCVDQCSGFFMECVADMCQFGSYTGMCPAP